MYCRRRSERAEEFRATLGFEHFNGPIAGRPVEPVTVRVTHIYNPGDDPRFHGGTAMTLLGESHD